MALIQVTGYITDNLTPQTGQSGRPYVRFELLEITGTLKLVDAYTKAYGKTKQLKVALEDCQLFAEPVLLHKPDKTVTDYPIRDLDGDRDVLPE